MSDATIWAAMGATAAATSALTGLTIHVANRVAEARRRPEADWIVRLWAWELEKDPYNQQEVLPGMISFRGEAMNCGDARAFSVLVTTSAGRAVTMSTPLATTSASGISAQYHDAFAALDPGAKFNFSGTIHESEWPKVEIVIDWITSPTRLKKHLQYSLKCADRVADPGPLYDRAE